MKPRTAAPQHPYSAPRKPAARKGSTGGRASDPPQLPDSLLRLMTAPKRLSAQRLWNALEPDEKSAAVRAVIRDRESRAQVVGLIAEARNFRRMTVQNWNDEKIVGQSRWIRLPNALAGALLYEMHLERRREMLARFLDALGIPNDDGETKIEEDELPTSGFAETDVWAAADDLEREHGLRRTVVYFLTLAIHGAPFVDHLWSWMGALSERPEEEGGTEPQPVPASDPEVEEDVEPEADPVRHRSFTTLDRLLVQAIVDGRQEVVGSLDEDEVDDAVDEFVNLNGARPQSYFHAGFRDILFDRGPNPGLPAMTGEQARWYWRGAIRGWARSESWADIAAAHDAQAVVRRLGDGADRAGETARQIVRALARAGRVEDVSEFVHVSALRQSRVLFREMLDVGTQALRNGDEGAAKAIFDRLMEGVRVLEEDGQPPASKLFLDVRRRWAHCLQRVLEHDRARRLLEELLELDPDPNHVAMVYADLGLLAGKFNSLADVRLPPDDRELRDLVDRLGEGREHFLRSVGRDVAYAAHGHYCLGVLALGESVLSSGESGYGKAEEHLFRARAAFGQRPRSYGAPLVTRTNLYFGIARAARAESAGDLAQAAGILVEALRAGATLPPYLVEPVVEGLDLGGAAEDLRGFGHALLESGGTAVLDALARSGQVLRHCPEVTDALRRRAESQGGSEAAAADLRVCLAAYLDSGRHEDAGDVLDRLETLARRDIGSAAFEELLAKRGYEPVWEPEEAVIAQARCLNAAGEMLDAFELLEPLVHRYASDGELHDAEGVLETIRDLGLGPDYYEGAAARVRQLRERHLDRSHDAAPSVETAGRRVRILFVGGDERQAKYDRVVQETLHRRDPNVAVTFIHPGWGGNWNVEWARVRRALPRHDAVVLMRFMRTHLGRYIRRHCDMPWRFCWRRGQEGMTDAILEAARAVRGAG